MDITNDIIYVGVDDTDLDLFEGQYAVPDGVSYNSYIVKDEKIAVVDAVDKRKIDVWLENVKNALAGANPEYLIISHMEPDHSAGIAAFVKAYPGVKLVGNEKTFVLSERFFGQLPAEKVSVKEGETLCLGKHNLKFIFAPMVHWPEVMLTYDESDKTLFSADAFGKFGALCNEKGDWTDEARRYYINIVGKYGVPVQGVLKKAAALDIKAICPLHGPVLKDNLGYYFDKYNVWSSYKPEDSGVLIAYASVYGNTAAAAKVLAEYLERAGEKVVLSDLARSDLSEAVAAAFRYEKTVLASVTLDAGIFPVAETFISELKAKNFQNRTVGLIENGSWAPVAGKLMRSAFEGMKNVTVCGVVTVNSVVTGETKENLRVLAEQLVK